jgi:hypothetical protein
MRLTQSNHQQNKNKTENSKHNHTHTNTHTHREKQTINTKKEGMILAMDYSDYPTTTDVKQP